MPITIKKKAVTTRRQSEEELKSLVHTFSDYAYARKKKLMPIGIGILALILIIPIYVGVRSGWEREASARLSAAYGYYSPAPGVTPDYNKALDLYRDIQKKYSSTKGGATAQYYIGNSLAALGQYPDALKEYQRFIKKYSSEKFLLGFVYQRMGYIYASLGNLAEAIHAFEQSEQIAGPGPATVELAHLYEKGNRTDDAQKKYKMIIQKFPGTQWSFEAMSKTKIPEPAGSQDPAGKQGSMK